MNKPVTMYACLYAREFPTQALLRLRPELQSKPCVVMQGDPPLQQVCSMSSKARLLGIANGMTRVEAETFPDLTILLRSPKAEAATRSVLLECVGAFSPRVEDRSEDTAFLCAIDVTGTEKLFGPPETLARTLWQRVRSLGLSAHIAISTNLYAAVCMAKGLSRKPTHVISPGGEKATLAPLSLNVLNLTPVQAETFALWGIRTLGMLADLPENGLIARMGQEGRHLQQLARGEFPHLFQPVDPPSRLEEHIELDSPVDLLDSLLFGLGVMLDQLLLRAKARLVSIASLTVLLSLEGGSMHTRSVRPALPSTDKQLWLKLLHLDLQAHPPQAPILAVALSAGPGNASKVQLGLFSPQLPEPARLDVTLARIRAIVGEDNVGRAVLLDTHAPENFRMEPFRIFASNTAQINSAPPRAAVRQIRPPQATPVTSQHQQPARFYFRSLRYTVERAYGPWLASGEWWTTALWGIEQWDVIGRAQDGSTLCCCLVHDLVQDQWHMRALYD